MGEVGTLALIFDVLISIRINKINYKVYIHKYIKHAYTLLKYAIVKLASLVIEYILEVTGSEILIEK